jgi:hypothetical protein
MNLKDALDHVLNWKKNPSSVFLIAVPLAVLGFGLMFTLAIVYAVANNDPWYLVIFAFGMGLFCLSMWSIRKLLFASITNKIG